jgi:hypothetical protein
LKASEVVTHYIVITTRAITVDFSRGRRKVRGIERGSGRGREIGILTFNGVVLKDKLTSFLTFGNASKELRNITGRVGVAHVKSVWRGGRREGTGIRLVVPRRQRNCSLHSRSRAGEARGNRVEWHMAVMQSRVVQSVRGKRREVGQQEVV